MTSLLQLQYLKRKFKQKDLTQRYRVRVLSTDLIFVKLSGYFVHYETSRLAFEKTKSSQIFSLESVVDFHSVVKSISHSIRERILTFDLQQFFSQCQF